MGRGAFFTVLAFGLALASPGAAQLHGRFHVELQATSRETRVALVGVSHHIESALARCAPHTHGAASTTRVTLRFTSAGHLRAIASADVEGAPAATTALRTCIEAAVHGATLPAVHDPELVLVVTYAPAAHTPEMSMEAAPTTAAYPEESVSRVVREHREEVAHCYEAARAEHPAAAGSIRMHVTIGADGRVTAAAATTDEPGIPSFTSCLVTAVRRWTFPAPASGAAVEVDYPFVFSRTGG